MPYLYAQAITTHRTGVPMMRAMFLEFSSDPAIWYLDQQYMLGSELLVAPVFNDDGNVTYYLPKGEWYGIMDKKVRHGPGYVTETYDFFGLPVLLRPGGVLVMGEGGERIMHDWSKGFRVQVNLEVGMDRVVEIPDYEKLGESALKLRIKSAAKEAVVEIVEGVTKSSWELLVVNKKFGKAGGGGEYWEGAVKVAVGEKKVVVTF